MKAQFASFVLVVFAVQCIEACSAEAVPVRQYVGRAEGRVTIEWTFLVTDDGDLVFGNMAMIREDAAGKEDSLKYAISDISKKDGQTLFQVSIVEGALIRVFHLKVDMESFKSHPEMLKVKIRSSDDGDEGEDDEPVTFVQKPFK